MKIIIEDTLKAIDLSHNKCKITLEDYDEEVKEMVKSFYNPKVDER